MDVASRLRQPLCIDTNIAYSLDLSKFPGLDDPQHKNQPSLLIASPVPAVSTDIIPSPTTMEIPGLNEELLDDLLSVIGNVLIYLLQYIIRQLNIPSTIYL